MLTEGQFMGNLSIGKTFRYQGHNLFLTRSDERFPVSIDYPQRGHLGNQVDQIVDLLRGSPDLAAMNHLDFVFGKILAGKELSSAGRSF